MGRQPINNQRGFWVAFAILWLLVCTMLAQCRPVHAEAVHLFTGGWSEHFAGAKDVSNERHDILAAEYRGWSAGYFRNSYGDDSFFAGRTWHWQAAPDVDTFATAGAVYGYTNCPGPTVGSDKRLCPGAFVGAAYTRTFIQPAVLASYGVVLLSIRWEIN